MEFSKPKILIDLDEYNYLKDIKPEESLSFTGDSGKYNLLIYYVHSCLESVRNRLVFTNETTVENFQNNDSNKYWCTDIFDTCLRIHNYELSHNQMCNGINLFLTCNKKQ